MSAPTITAPATASGGVPVGGSGAAGYLAKWTAATTLGGSTTTGATASPYVDATGQVGIFTATPAEALTVAAGSNDRVGLSVTSAVSTLLLGSKLATEGARQLEFDRSTGIFAIKYGNTGSPFTTGFAMDGTGNVGIGTASPVTKLDVAYGDYLTTGAMRIGADVGTNTTRTDATGKVGAISIPHFTNASANAFLIGSYANTASTTLTYIGGGLGNMNASTRVSIYAGATSTTSPGTEIVAATTAGLSLGSTATLVFSASVSGQGIKLATGPTNTDPNTLDCYAEGTWTPTLSAAASWGGTQPTVGTARYVRIGSTVYCTVVLVGAPNFSSTYLSTTITAPFSATYNAAVPISSGATAFGCAQLNSGATTIFMPTFGVVGAATLSWTFIG